MRAGRVELIPENVGQRHNARVAGINEIGRVLDRIPLPPREQEVAPLVADGLTHHEIAEALSISTRTVGNTFRTSSLRHEAPVTAVDGAA